MNATTSGGMLFASPDAASGPLYERYRPRTLDGQPESAYVRLAQRCKNNFRAMLQAVEAGAMLDDGDDASSRDDGTDAHHGAAKGEAGGGGAVERRVEREANE
jgi:hypothetical protein